MAARLLPGADRMVAARRWRGLRRADQRSSAQCHKQIAVGLRGLPSHIELGVFGFDQPLPDLQQL